MNKKHLGIVALFILCFSFALAGKSAQAATTPQETSVSKIAYVDASGRLVLKFADFSDAGYTYTVTNEKNRYRPYQVGNLPQANDFHHVLREDAEQSALLVNQNQNL